jgi:hypothetical protein
MRTTFQVEPHELDASFLEVLQSIMKGRSTKITVEPLANDKDELEMDETEFLLSNAENKATLLKSIAQIKSGNVIEMSWEDHNKMSEELKLRIASGE